MHRFSYLGGTALVSIFLWTSVHAQPASECTTITLSQALRLLDDQSLSLQQARARAQESQALVTQSMSVLLPTLNAGGSYTRNSAEAQISLSSAFNAIEGGLRQATGAPIHIDRSQVPSDQIIQPLEAFTASGALRVPIFVGQAYADLAATRAAARAADESAQSVRLQLQAALVQTAWWSEAMDETTAASERALSVAREHEQSANRAVRAGTAAPLALLQAKTEVVRRENDIVRARSERDRARWAVGVLLGKAEPTRVLLPELKRDTAFDASALLQEALAGRPEIRVQENLVQVARSQLHSANWRWAPQLAANGSAFASNVAYATGDKTGWRATLDLSWALYDGGLRQGKHDQAQAAMASARAALAEEKVKVAQQIADNTRDVQAADERLTLAERQQELALETARSANRGFDVGITSSLDVLDANDRLYQAEMGLADARARLAMAWAALTRTLGREQ